MVSVELCMVVVSSKLGVGSSFKKRSSEAGKRSELWTQDPKSTIGGWSAHYCFRGLLKQISIEPAFDAARNGSKISNSEIYRAALEPYL